MNGRGIAGGDGAPPWPRPRSLASLGMTEGGVLGITEERTLGMTEGAGPTPI